MTTKSVGHRLADRIARDRGFDDLAAWVLTLRGARRWTPAPSWESVASVLGSESDGEISITGAGLQLWFKDEIAAEREPSDVDEDVDRGLDQEPLFLTAAS